MDNSNQKVMGILSYIGPLVIVSYLTSKDDSFVKFHVKQGMVLLVIEVAVWFLGMVFWLLAPILSIVNIVTLVFSIIGIMNVLKNQQKSLPLVGSFSRYFNF